MACLRFPPQAVRCETWPAVPCGRQGAGTGGEALQRSHIVTTYIHTYMSTAMPELHSEYTRHRSPSRLLFWTLPINIGGNSMRGDQGSRSAAGGRVRPLAAVLRGYASCSGKPRTLTREGSPDLWDLGSLGRCPVRRIRKYNPKVCNRDLIS